VTLGPYLFQTIIMQVRGDDSDEESGVSFMLSDSTRAGRSYRRPPFSKAPSYLSSKTSSALHDAPPANSAPPEVLNFIERQEDYIDQLEKESQYCRVKEKISIFIELLCNQFNSVAEVLKFQQKRGGFNVANQFKRKIILESPILF